MLKQAIKRARVKVRQKRNKKPEMSDVESKYIDVAINLIKDTDSELFMSPNSNKRCIRKDDMYMTLTPHTGILNIINGIYHYELTLTKDQESYVLRFFNKTLERRISQLETQIKSNVTKSLDDILEDIKSKKV
jgi:hypothetical protein